jgi:hypothetical protein
VQETWDAQLSVNLKGWRRDTPMLGDEHLPSTPFCYFITPKLTQPVFFLSPEMRRLLPHTMLPETITRPKFMENTCNADDVRQIAEAQH